MTTFEKTVELGELVQDFIKVQGRNIKSCANKESEKMLREQQEKDLYELQLQFFNQTGKFILLM